MQQKQENSTLLAEQRRRVRLSQKKSAAPTVELIRWQPHLRYLEDDVAAAVAVGVVAAVDAVAADVVVAAASACVVVCAVLVVFENSPVFVAS